MSVLAAESDFTTPSIWYTLSKHKHIYMNVSLMWLVFFCPYTTYQIYRLFELALLVCELLKNGFKRSVLVRWWWCGKTFRCNHLKSVHRRHPLMCHHQQQRSRQINLHMRAYVILRVCASSNIGNPFFW